MIVIDEDRATAFDHAGHTAVDCADLHHALNHLDGAAMLIDDDRESRSLDDGGEHRRVDREVGDAGMLDLEQQSAEILNHASEAGRLRR
jgi:hypothetical protein